MPVSRADGSAWGALSVSGLISHFDQTFQAAAIALLQGEARELETRLVGL